MLPLLSAAACAAPPTPATDPPAWACPLGPVVGGAVVQPTVEPGRYEIDATYSQHDLPTMELSIDRAIATRAWVDLGRDGAFDACVGVEDTTTSDESRYQARDGQDHHDVRRIPSLTHFGGRWTASYDGVRLVVDRIGVDCAKPAEQTWYPEQLVCGSLAGPTRILACRAIGLAPWLETAGLDLGPGPRAGAWALRFRTMDRAPPSNVPSCGPWLLLGASPGLRVHVVEDRSDPSPSVKLEAAAPPPLDPARFEP